MKNYFLTRLDRLAAYVFFWLILAYTLAFGIIQLGGLHIENFSLGYFSVIIPIWIVDGFKSFFESFMIHNYHRADEDIRKITVVIACKDGQDVISATLSDLVQRFDPKQIILASNGSTDKTCEIGRAYGVVVLDVTQPLGKVRAINHALQYVKTPYVLLLDDDTLVGKAHMPTGLLDEGYEAVAFRVLVKRSSWVTKFQSYEYRKSTDIGKRFHNKNASVQNISGAIGLFSLKHLRQQIHRHTGEFSGEDLQRTLLIHLSKDVKGVVLSDSTVTTQPPSTLKTLFDQRVFGWYPGLYSNFTNYLKILTRDVMPRALRIDAFYNCFLVILMDVVRLLSLPILFFYPWFFVVMYISYLFFEAFAFHRIEKNEPLWVVLFYPLYGLFNFITRMCALAAFMYRRLCVKLSSRKFLDDFRSVKPSIKLGAIALTTIVLCVPLVLNIVFVYSKHITDISL